MCRPWRWPCSAWASPRCSAAKPCRERELVLAMVAARIVAPHTKLATTRWWHTTTLAEDFGVADADEDDLYAAMDWLLARQDAIQKKLAARHLSAGGLVLYDLSSSYFEGTTCPLAKLGYNRDGKQGHAAGQLRLAHRCARLPGGGVGARGQRRRQPDLPARGAAAARGLRHRAAGDGGRPRHDLQQGHRRAARDRRHRLDHGAEERLDPRAGRARATAAGPVRRAQPARAQLAATTRASGWWRAAIRSWPSCARTSARSCSRPPRRNLREDQGPGGCGQARRRR